MLRTRLRQEAAPGQRQKYTGLLQTFRLVLREEGPAAFYGGLSAHLLRVVPVSLISMQKETNPNFSSCQNAAIMFCVYETALTLGSK